MNPPNRLLLLTLLVVPLARTEFSAQAAGPLERPTLREAGVLLGGRFCGKQTVTAISADSAQLEYSYNDRGRGEHIVASWKLDAQGTPVEYLGRGHDYMKAAVEESYRIADGKAIWKNRTEQGMRVLNGPAFFMPLNAPPEFTAVLARALLKAPDHRLPLLPMGEARLEIGEHITLNDAAKTQITQYRISGLDFSPISVWLDAQGEAAALVSNWFAALSVLPTAWHQNLPALQAAQRAADDADSARLAQKLTHVPKGELVIRHARLFDPRDLSVTANVSVLIRGPRIVRIANDADLYPAPDAEIIDARGHFLMPGLWDNHQHFNANDGALDLAAGVTSARDMANDTDTFLKRVERFDSGAELGPRVLKAGIIDGPGEFAGPTKVLVDTAEAAVKAVDWYADHGYAQIKIYSSVKPELVPIIADHADARGLRVSGHVPAFMSARQFIEAGAEEIQHFNFIELQFLYPQVKETRNRDRFVKVAEHAHEFTPDKPQVRDFIAFLAHHHTVLDPTLGIFEALFDVDHAQAMPGLQHIAPRFPPQVGRIRQVPSLDPPPDQTAAYREALPSMLKLLKALYEAGVTIIPGTDGTGSMSGYMLHHELELYARAGIPATKVLRLATLTSAQVMGITDRGVIAAGKLADLILIDGDPVARIADIENVELVIKDGKVFDPAAIEQAIGIAPRPALAAAGPQFSVQRVSEDVRILASNAFAGREPGSAGETKTIGYIIAQMRAAGLHPGGTMGADGKRGWTQAVPLLRAEISGKPRISIDMGGKTQSLTQGTEVAMRAPLDGRKRLDIANAPLVFVGYGVTAPERKWDDFKGIDLHGKVMLVLANDPDFEPGKGDFGGKEMTYYGRWPYKYEEAARHGALGVLIIHEIAATTYGWTTLSNSMVNAQFDIVRKNPADHHTALEGWITRELAVQLFQQSGLDFEAAKRRAQRREFTAVTLQPTFSAHYLANIGVISSKNVLGRLPGKARPDETIIYSAHWDHLGVGQPDAKGDRIYNGAWDNASGVAGLLELARNFAKARNTDRSVVFLALTAEEKGLLGSEYYSVNPIYPLTTVAAVLNMDAPFGFGYGKAHDFSIAGPAHLELLDMLIAAAAKQGLRYTPDPQPEAGHFFRSDHFPFAKAGVPAVTYESGIDLVEGGTARGMALQDAYAQDRYHQPADEWTPDFDLSGAPQVLELLYAVGYDLADSADWPNWSRDSEFRAVRDASADRRH